MMRSAPRRLVMGVMAGIVATFSATTAFGNVTPRVKPPAPGPSYLSQSDHDLLLSISGTLKKKRFSQAKSNINSLSDPIAKSLGEWMYFMAEDPLVSLEETDAFLASHDDWPATSRIQGFTEKRINSKTPVKSVRAFFDSRDPVTGDGKVQLARALFANGEEDAGGIHLRDAWVNNNFTISKERAILSSHKKQLSKDDHAARVDRLLWARQVTNARRVFSRLDSYERKKAEARAALLLGAATGPGLYNKLSKDDQLDSGVLLAAVRYYRRSGNEAKAISLAAQSPKDPETLRNSRRWWYERQLLMRTALKKGRFADAYTAASNHGLEPGGDYAEAEFNAGWIALRFLNQPERAETHFLALASAVRTPISLSRAFYWLGRTSEARNNDDLATAYYQTAAQYYYSYYGQLAAEELGGNALQQKFPTPIPASAEEKARFSSRPTVAALRMLSDLNLGYEFMVFSYHVDDQLDRPGEYLELASLANGEGAPHLTVRAGKVAVKRNAFAPDVSYPIVFVPDEAKRFIEPEIILGLSRQESEFNPRAYSRAGARGVMQLIPSTAQITARKEGLPYLRSALLDDPTYNMTLGSAHLSHLLDRFDGSLILTFAGYNAGASRSDRWMQEYGDPRLDGVDPIDWVELIPFSETRNYVQRVLENMQVYRGRLNNAPIPGQLSDDLERGGTLHRAAKEASIPSHTLNTLSKSFSIAQISPLPATTIKRAAEYQVTLASTRASALTISAPIPIDTSLLQGHSITPVITPNEAHLAPRLPAVPTTDATFTFENQLTSNIRQVSQSSLATEENKPEEPLSPKSVALKSHPEKSTPKAGNFTTHQVNARGTILISDPAVEFSPSNSVPQTSPPALTFLEAPAAKPVQNSKAPDEPFSVQHSIDQIYQASPFDLDGELEPDDQSEMIYIEQ